MNIVVVCEGESEADVVKAVLNPFLRSKGRQGALRSLNMKGSGHFFARIARVVEKAIREDEVDRVFGLLDLQGSGLSYPQRATSPAQKADYLQKHLRKIIPSSYRDRFHPHVAVHQIEAWILADEDSLARYLKGAAPVYPTPETVNFDSPPDRRLQELFQRHKGIGYKKSVHGNHLLRMIDPDIVMKKCPHFKLLVDDLLAVTA